MGKTNHDDAMKAWKKEYDERDKGYDLDIEYLSKKIELLTERKNNLLKNKALEQKYVKDVLKDYPNLK